jgi:transcriptional regulator with XRE-family HTH domain
MHALGEYLSEEIHRRGWTAAELARRAGLTKQSVSNLMADKPTLGRMLERRTFAGLAEALGVPSEVLVLKAADAMGIPVPPPPISSDLPEAPATLEELERFLRSGVPVPELFTYLHRYLHLASVVAHALAEAQQDEGGFPPVGDGDPEHDGHRELVTEMATPRSR